MRVRVPFQAGACCAAALWVSLAMAHGFALAQKIDREAMLLDVAAAVEAAKAGGNPNSRTSNKPRFSPCLTQAAPPLMSPDSFAFTAPQSVVLPALRDYEPPLGLVMFPELAVFGPMR